jgi:hypothetical protein
MLGRSSSCYLQEEGSTRRVFVPSRPTSFPPSVSHQTQQRSPSFPSTIYRPFFPPLDLPRFQQDSSLYEKCEAAPSAGLRCCFCN